ncbi:SRPBCC family protein [Skermania sp. ID1734]|uniref:SRPBCC family protein n=1 Tax=Skermania sp. ID1734 TaxID=2597516 RepID=UPI00117CC372|nr:SRPBCC family protein [Skermania sp. ID1734]TSE00779.1 SRPBCC family protein [Skermania sp. ID1734]
MATTTQVQESVQVAVPVDKAFYGTLPIPLESLFKYRHGPIPPIKSVRNQNGEWGTPGQTRDVHLADGGSIREELLTVDAPSSFSYQLTNIRGPLALLFSHVDGRWLFEPDGTGTRITWQWTLRPRSGATRLVAPAFARFWHGYAKKSLRELANQLQSG